MNSDRVTAYLTGRGIHRLLIHIKRKIAVIWRILLSIKN